MAGGSIAFAADKYFEAALESTDERARRQQLAVRGGELDGQRQTVKPRADRGDRGCVVRSERQRGLDGSGTLEEQRHGLDARQLLRRWQLLQIRQL